MSAYFILLTLVLYQNVLVHTATIAQDASKCSNPGETVPAGDGCNTCFCNEDGTLVKCTIEACVEIQDITSKEGEQEGEPCGLGLEQNKGECRNDLECVFGESELIGTCQVKKENDDCSIYHDEGFEVTTGAICQGETKKDWNDDFDIQFKEENLINCRKFCNCKKDCEGFTFNPNSKKRKCSWKTTLPVETLKNEGIQKSGQSCVFKVPIKCCLALTASCVAGCQRQTVEGYCRNNPKTFVCTEYSTNEKFDAFEECCNDNKNDLRTRMKCAAIRIDCRKNTKIDQCGIPSTSAQIPRILGGSGVIAHSQPWVARLGPCCQCTGTLISDRHILTAAHCDLFVNPRVATLGDYDSQKVEIGEVRINVKTVTRHPLFWLEGDTAGYDFAVWTLEEKVQFSKTIQPVCLPSSANESYAGSQVINSGWGLSYWTVGDPEPSLDYGNLVLNTIKLTTFPMKECKNTEWLSDRLNKTTTPGRDLDDTMMICAGVPPSSVTDQWIGANKGDSGGPLTVKNSESGASVLIGVATDCPYTWEQYRTGPYCTYSRVSAVLPWIHETMKTN